MIPVVIPVQTVPLFVAYLLSNGLSTGADAQSILINKSVTFLGSLSYCKEVPDEVFIDAENILSYMFSTNGGLDPFVAESDKFLSKKGLGRNALVSEWKMNESLQGSGSLGILKKSSLAFSILSPYLCPDPCDPCNDSMIPPSHYPMPVACSF